MQPCTTTAVLQTNKREGAASLDFSDLESDAYLIEPFATSERDGYSLLSVVNDFIDAVDTLKSHAGSRVAALESYFANL